MGKTSIQTYTEKSKIATFPHIIILKVMLFCCSSCSVVANSVNPWMAPHHASLSLTIFLSLSKFISTELMMPSNQLILCCLLLLLPSILPSVKVFFKDSDFCIRWPKQWSFSISSFNEYSELITFRIDWFDFLAVQGTLKSLIQHQSSKASILQHSAYLMVQLSHPYITTGKTGFDCMDLYWQTDVNAL